MEHVLYMFAWVSSDCSSFIPHPKDVQVGGLIVNGPEHVGER